CRIEPIKGALFPETASTDTSVQPGADCRKDWFRPMNYEVELKFRIDEPTGVDAMLTGLEATQEDLEEHRDTYFSHPARDFAQTDEAFRIRSIGEANRLTYKGPLVDKQTKTRQEVEVGCEA